MGETVNVAIYFDRNFAPHAATMVRSLLDNAAPGGRVNLFILGVGLTPEIIAKTAASWPAGRLTTHWIAVGPSSYGDAFAGTREPEAHYARLLIDRLLPRDVSRVITLDCDGLVLDDIGVLWRHAPRYGCVSAAVDAGVLRLWDGVPPSARPLEAGGKPPYFNSGVMVINLELVARASCHPAVPRSGQAVSGPGPVLRPDPAQRRPPGAVGAPAHALELQQVPDL